MSHLNVVVLSGGLDSTTALAEAVATGNETCAVSFGYGQKHAVELSAAQIICDLHYRIHHKIISLPEAVFRGGALTTDIELPSMRYEDLPSGEMSPTYVPFRNGSMLSFAAAYADSILRETEKFMDGEFEREVPSNPYEAATIWAGMHAEDAQGFAYADCTPEFLGAMAAAIYVGTYGRVRLHCPFQAMEKWQIVKRGAELDVPFGLTHSCYRGTSPACGTCATCQSRLDAFERAGVEDPIEYEVVRHGR